MGGGGGIRRGTARKKGIFTVCERVVKGDWEGGGGG